MSSDCVFCAIVRGDETASFTHEDDTVVAFMDIQPITRGHMLVVPRVHAELMDDVDETVALRAFRVARRMASLARHTLGATGANLLVMDGEAAFQDVPHFHIHVIPRYAGDGFGLTFPEKYEHPPGRAELEAVAVALRAAAS